MRLSGGKLRLSATDLMAFMGCRHATTLDLRRIEVGDIAPAGDSEEAALLQAQGDSHELRFLDQLKGSSLIVVEIPKDGLPITQSVRLTNEAMRDGADIIFQGALQRGAWGGYSDFLQRVPRPSVFGDWSYEVVDTKLKRRPDPKHVLQLVLYSDLLAEVQCTHPLSAHLQLGDGSRYTVNLSDVSAYARHAREVFQDFLATRPETTSEPVSACGLCKWRIHCADEWDMNDSLSLVAGITRSQRKKIEEAGLPTLGALAATRQRIPKLASDTQARLQAQAILQRARRSGGLPTFELRPTQPGKGFSLLPLPNDGDLFYDIEGDPYFDGGSLEYLHGVWWRLNGEWTFRAIWAHDRQSENRAVVELLDFFTDHLRANPGAHIYHYAPYEITALRRLTSTYSARETAMDQLQREGRFVDLYKVVAGAITASEPGYSIKNLESFYMEKRDADVATAGASVVVYNRWRESGDNELLQMIHDYNRTDCISTQLLRDWLIRDVRPADLPWPARPADVSTDDPDRAAEEDAETEALRASLAPVAVRLGQEVADLLLDLNLFHRREDKPAWWAIFDRLAMESGELIDDLDCLAGLEAITDTVEVTAKSHERTYRFPPQETKLRAGQRPCIKPAAMPDDVDLRAIDVEATVLTLRRSIAKGALPDRLDLLPGKPIDNRKLREAIAATTQQMIEARPGTRAIEHLLTRRAPAFSEGERPGGIIDPSGDLISQVSAAIADMDDTVLGIQGPPGCGKTFVSALAIVDLVRGRRRVAVSSNSHKAIGNLLKAVAERAASEGVPCRIVQKSSDDADGGQHPGIARARANDGPEIDTADVVGATAWHFARYEEAAFDHLFIDEAGQVSLANVVAMARAARNLVLVGDPMQLPQPLSGVHPGRSGASCLEYLIDGPRVIAPERGIFMPVSRRMHPNVCRFISEIAYESKLISHETAASQRLITPAGRKLAGVGLHTIPHTGRSQVSPEEVSAVAGEVERLVGSKFRDALGRERLIRLDDFLVVAPYNAQVNALRAALPDSVRVGTVDKFQGQEAPICLVSMTTSGAEELPRDLGFLFSLNRINVAVSRAQILSVVFASPRLLETPCRSIEEMTLVNTLCRLKDHRLEDF